MTSGPGVPGPRPGSTPGSVTDPRNNPFVRRPWLWFLLPIPVIVVVAVFLRDPLILGAVVLVELVGTTLLYRQFKKQHDEAFSLQSGYQDPLIS